MVALKHVFIGPLVSCIMKKCKNYTVRECRYEVYTKPDRAIRMNFVTLDNSILHATLSHPSYKARNYGNQEQQWGPRQLLNNETRFQSHGSPCWTWGGQSVTLFAEYFGSPLQVTISPIPPHLMSSTDRTSQHVTDMVKLKEKKLI